LEAARDALEKLHPKTEREKQQVKAKVTEIENKITRVHKLINESLITTGEALLPEKLRDRLTAATAKFKADSTFAQSLTGKAAEDFQATLLDDVLGEKSILNQELTSLRAQLKGSKGKQKQAIQQQIAKVKSALSGVQQQIVSTLQQQVTTLQGRVASAYQRVQQQFLAQLGGRYFQNGALTPLEQQLADMNAEDTRKQLQDALNQAETPEEKAAAQRAIDENDLAVRAARERADADAEYSKKSAELTDRLDKLTDSFQNGTGSMDELRQIADLYGIQISADTIPDFTDLGSATSALYSAFVDLAGYIGQITGVTPKVSLSPGAIAARQSALGQMMESFEGTNVRRLGIPQLAVGGDILSDGLIYGHAGETVVPADVSTPFSGSDTHSASVRSFSNELELGLYIGRLMQKANKSGVKFQLV
jgi:hypothetical protein